jgi:hypothetical protein
MTHLGASPQSAVTAKPIVAYILAASHSGSTLLAMLLGSHRDACTVGELKATSLGNPDTYRCSCGELIRACRFWRDVTARMAERGRPFDVLHAKTNINAGATPFVTRLLRPLHRGRLAEAMRDAALSLSPSWRANLGNFHALNASLITTLCERSDVRVVVDSSKIGIRLKYLLKNPDLDVRVIRLTRDGRAVALTYMDPSRYADATDPSKRGGGDGSDREGERLSIEDAAREWRRSNEEAAALVAGLPRARYVTASYEELCQSTDSTLNRIHAFLGLEPAGLARDWRSQEHHVIGNGMRLDSESAIRLDDRWKTALSPQDLAAFESEAGSLNRALGYH